jgi:mRNA interferase MazF
MNNRRGDVVILDFPFSDASGSKVRPALVVQSDANNVRLRSTIVALITKNIQRAAQEPAHLLIDVTTSEGQASGLHTASAVTCNNLFTVHEQRILRTIGWLPSAAMQRIDACLKAALDIT